MSLHERAQLTVVDTRRAASSGGLFDSGSHARLLEQVRLDTRPEPSFQDLAKILLSAEADWMPQARCATQQLEKRLHGGDKLYIAMTGLVERSLRGAHAVTTPLAQYRIHDMKLFCELEIPGQQISAIRGRSFVDYYQGHETRAAAVDMQIKTDTDEAVHIFSLEPQADGSNMKSQETGGRWYTFPLDVVKLELTTG